MLDSLLAASEPMSLFLYACIALAGGMLIWNTIEVGRNDAANLVNAVFGARILSRETAVWVAGAGVLLGAVFSSSVIETARKGIFAPSMLDIEQALAIYAAVYIVNTVLLYGYSAFGMPVSTTACLVFALLGASFAIGGGEVVHWGKASEVVSAIVLSIFISGVASFLIQRAVRGAIRDRGHRLTTLLQHGGWVGGAMLTGLCYFMLVKGMRNVEFVKNLNQEFFTAYGAAGIILGLWTIFAIAIHGSLVLFRERAARWLFPTLAIIGMLCMGFAFGQNDLANCASPGLAAINLIQHRADSVASATEVPIAKWMLAACGLLLLLGMTTKNAQRVTRAEVNTGSMSHHVSLWAPRWCIALARVFLKMRGRAPTLAPPPITPVTGETRHYDPLRACVILCVSASVIATASGLGLPVSTTYVAFAAVVATGAADRILQRGDAELKLARTIWVISSWFAAAFIATLAAGIVCRTIFHLGVAGIVISVTANMALRSVLKKRGDAQEARAREEGREREYPEQFTEYEG